MIKFYKTKDPYGFLNNFYKSKFYAYSRYWETVEHAYQAQKTENLQEQLKIWAAKTPRMARDMGQLVQMRPDWDKVKIQVMKQCVWSKFTQNKELAEKLLATGDEELIEDSPVDSFWGCGKDGNGQNNLGKVLMEVRNEIKK